MEQLYSNIFRNPLTRARLARLTVALCHLHGYDYEEGAAEWPADDDYGGIYVVFRGVTLGWLPLDHLLVPYE
jgi:hypothetical protein